MVLLGDRDVGLLIYTQGSGRVARLGSAKALTATDAASLR
jgi:hypothetical protein